MSPLAMVLKIGCSPLLDPPKSDLAVGELTLTIGDTAFDAVDRLAIINLFGAYAYTYDENQLDEFRGLFTESPELALLHEDRTVSANIDTVMNFLAARKAAFKAENNQRRHALNSFWFTCQNATEATGRCYVQVFGIRDAGPPSPELTGCYEFTAVKHDGVWRFSRWVVALDQASV
jgi:SnoaL-like domain